MNNRIALVLKTKNISPSQLADDLGVQRSGISHIVNGRNKPSLEFIQKLIKLYPDISMQWILFGEGPMMNPYSVQLNLSDSGKVAGLFPDEKPKPRIMELFNTDDEATENHNAPEKEKASENILLMPDFPDDFKIEETSGIDDRKTILAENIPIREKDVKPVSEPEVHSGFIKPESESLENENKKPVQPVKADRKISKILVFYNDRTFVEYSPGEE
jgi:transcriptional regulator with XRE-family HTH domain